MKIKSDDYRVRAGESVKLKQRPTRVKPIYKSKEDYRALLAAHIEGLRGRQELERA